jgi:hypothetical protein
MKLYTFRTVPLTFIRRLFTVHSAMVYVIQVCRPFSSSTCSQAVYKPVWHIPLLSVQWINSWWWTDELSKTFRVSWQNKLVKLVHLVGFITKKFVMMHGHMDLKFVYLYMKLLVVFLLMNHQRMVMNHLKFGLIVLGGNISNYCNLHSHNIVKKYN